MSYKQRLQSNNTELDEIIDVIDELPDNTPAPDDSPMPHEIDSAEKMNSILKNATADNVGEVYKYVGGPSDVYEYGQLYIIAEVK